MEFLAIVLGFKIGRLLIRRDGVTKKKAPDNQIAIELAMERAYGDALRGAYLADCSCKITNKRVKV
jgi:hypothetical protein